VHLEWNAPPRQWDMWDYTAAFMALAGLGAAVSLYFNVPLWGCLFRRLTGWPCLSCGLTRATLSLAGGQLGQALHYNPLGTLVEMALLPAALWGGLSRLFGWKRPFLQLSSHGRRRLWYGVAVAVLLNYIQLLSYHRP